MVVMVTDPLLQERLKEERAACGADRYDEVWEGIYMMAPMPTDEHQQIVTRIAAVLQETVGWSALGEVRAGVNLSDRDEAWEQNYRVPDVAVFLRRGTAENRGTHWRGGADFLVEVTSPDDRTREKIPFYGRIGVVELLVVDGQSWTLELHRRQRGRLQEVGRSSLQAANVLRSGAVPLSFQVVSGDSRPHIEVRHAETGRCWLV